VNSTSQPQPSPPCQCQQQFGAALPWLALALVVVFALDRWNSRRRKNSKIQPEGAAESGPEEEGKK
jgi:hypothetical protein